MNMETLFSRRLTPEEIKEKVRAFYDVGSPYYLEVWGQHIHDGYYITGRESKEEAQVNLTRLLAERAEIRAGDRILDVGCGMGGSSIWLTENLRAVTAGITISPEQVEIAERLARERRVDSSFQVMDAENMHLDQTFDVVWAVASMTHLRDQGSFVQAATRLLNRGGRFVVFDWMLGEDIADAEGDQLIGRVSEGMLLSSLHAIATYADWFDEYGYRILYSEDITEHTRKTWDDVLVMARNPAVWRLVFRATAEVRSGVLDFLKTISPMKRAMQQGKLISGAIVAEKI
ncbi:MAG: hypothetical protein A2147_11040 [Chloroflexi bacterium RBG_16_57_8]|nr:MAG: hypothetical protein A2147_11040 [Chloroflexi bacterium RBG_16_57_8]